MQEYQQFKNILQGEWFEFQQDSLIKDLKIMIIFPPTVQIKELVYCYTIENGEKILLKELKLRKRGNRQYIYFHKDVLEANKVLRFEFAAKI